VCEAKSVCRNQCNQLSDGSSKPRHIVIANQQATQEWWHERSEQFKLFVSQLVVQEAFVGDADAISRRHEAISRCRLLTVTRDAVELAERLIVQGANSKKAAEDALHVSIAAVNGMDYLITWNFKHIANAAIRANIELVCRLNGYEPPVICTALELMAV
jgi:polynucleotide 5'-kinase involved in rRNA processing